VRLKGGNMKKLILIFFCFIFVPRLYSQDFKFLQGINLSRYNIHPEVFVDSLGNEYEYNINNIKGFIIGTGIEFPVASKITVEIDALLQQKGSEVTLQLPYSLLLEWNYTLNVINFPVMLKIRPLSSLPAYILGGGEFSLVLSHKSNEADVTGITKSFDYGAVLGGGYEIKMKNNSIFIEIRYHLGLKNISENLRFESVKTNTIAIILAFKVG